MKNGKKIFLLFCFGLPTILLTINSAGNVKSNIILGSNPKYSTFGGNLDPIRITGNSALAAFIESEELSGEGTFTSPYIIEDFIINASTATGIEIQNTDTFLIIRNCTIENGNTNGTFGIFLNNTQNVIIKNNSLNNNYHGIYLHSSSNNSLTGNFANNSSNSGILLNYASNNNNINENTVNNNGWMGIAVGYYSSYNTFNQNHAYYNRYGMQMFRASNNLFSENKFNYNGDGIFLFESCDNNLFSTNNVSYNLYGGFSLSSSVNNFLYDNWVTNNLYGIGISDSNTTLLTGNTARNNHDHGITLMNAHGNMITWNTVKDNERYGIDLQFSTSNNVICLNNVYDNTDGQAFADDSGINNRWDNGSFGNYWGVDYINRYPSATNDGRIWNLGYEIDGSGNDFDNFPLVHLNYWDIENPQFIVIPEDISIAEGYSNVIITWIAKDPNPATYTIELNGNEVVSATVWISEFSISYILPDGFVEGTYHITVVVTDQNGNTLRNTVIINITQTKTSTSKKTGSVIPGFSFIFTIFSVMLIFFKKKKSRVTFNSCTTNLTN